MPDNLLVKKQTSRKNLGNNKCMEDYELDLTINSEDLTI